MKQFLQRKLYYACELSPFYHNMTENSRLSVEEIDQTAVLVAQLAHLYMTADNADVTFIVQGEHLPAHRNILAARSEYFRALLYGGLKESKQNEISMDVPVEAFKYLMTYIYTGCLSPKQVNHDDLLDILKLAHQYQFIDLQKAISDYLCKVICLDNVCAALDTACLLNLPDLASACYTFMEVNSDSIIKQQMFRTISHDILNTLLERSTFYAPEVKLFQAVLDWCRYNSEQGNQSEELFNKIRFTLMSRDDLLNVVRSANVLSQSRLLDILAEKERLTKLPYRAPPCKHTLWNGSCM